MGDGSRVTEQGKYPRTSRYPYLPCDKRICLPLNSGGDFLPFSQCAGMSLES